MRYAFFDPDFSRIEFEFKSCALSRVRMRIFIPDLLLNYEWKARKNKIGAKKKKSIEASKNQYGLFPSNDEIL